MSAPQVKTAPYLHDHTIYSQLPRPRAEPVPQAQRNFPHENLFILVGVLTIFEATLTLPGIAGIILTVGMAVDANVLIFERIKEELKNEKNILIAFDSGYTKSRTAILDANITTLLAAIILFFMGSGPIKGFSLTLGVGIFTTLFSVYFIARLLTVIYVSKNKEKEGLI